MPHDSRNDSLERIRELPGPGSYELFDTPIKTQAPKAKFGRAGRDNHSKSQNRLPGPGEYSHSDTLVKAGASHWTIGKAARDN